MLLVLISRGTNLLGARDSLVINGHALRAYEDNYIQYVYK